jgi:hypothetical protein
MPVEERFFPEEEPTFSQPIATQKYIGEYRRRAFPQVWAGKILVGTGVALFALGGLFPAGVGQLLFANSISARRFSGSPIQGAPIIIQGAPMPYQERMFLQVVLYGLALACVTTASLLLFLGIRGLYRIFQEKPTQT